jgi:hypothetical protein
MYYTDNITSIAKVQHRLRRIGFAAKANSRLHAWGRLTLPASPTMGTDRRLARPAGGQLSHPLPAFRQDRLLLQQPISSLCNCAAWPENSNHVPPTVTLLGTRTSQSAVVSRCQQTLLSPQLVGVAAVVNAANMSWRHQHSLVTLL